MATFKFSKLSPIKKDPYLILVFAIWVLTVISTVMVLIYLKNRLPETVPLFYSRIWGEGRLAQKNFLFLLPLGNLFFGIFNLGFSLSFFQKEIFLTRVLQIVTIVISVLTLFSLINIVNLIG
ncbi:MAG: hypothetical protein Q7S14_03415 [bacterium]|nr:hypothetical protein [bacterium]